MEYYLRYPLGEKDPRYWVERPSCIVRLDSPGRCYQCRKWTYWADLTFEAHVCSTECTEAMEAEYVAHCVKLEAERLNECG